MSETNDSGNGTGLSVAQAAERLAGILDSDNTTTHEPDSAENEVEETSLPSDEIDESSPERPLEDSEEQVGDEPDVAVEAEDPNVIRFADDMVFEIDGQKVTAAQLRDERMIKAEFTRRTQELAAERKKYDAGQFNLDQVRGQAINELSRIEQEIAWHLPQQPDWARLAHDDPAEYVAQQERWKQINDKVQGLRNQRAQLEQQQAQYRNQQYQSALNDGRRILAQMHPELGDEKTGKSAALGKYLLDAGVPKQALENETNPVLFSLAYKAMQFDQLQSQKAQAVKRVDAKPQLTTPGSSPARASSSQAAYDSKLKQLKKSGSVRDAAEVLKHIL